MLNIRPVQAEALKQARVARSAEELTVTLCQRYPIHCQVAGHSALRGLVDAGVTRSMALGLTRWGEVLTYVELTLLLGHDFEKDPQLLWTGEILAGREEIPMVQRLGQVYAKAIEFLDQVAGLNGVNLDQALRHIQRTPTEKLIPPSSPDFHHRLVRVLWWVFPEKATALGDSNMAALVCRGKKQAEGLGMGTPFGEGLCVWLMYLLGSGFADDPLFPWVREVLEAETAPDARAQRLEQEARDYLGRWLRALAGAGA